MKAYMHKVLTILIIACSLQACVGIVLVGLGAVIGGAVVYEGRNFDTKKEDFKIAQEADKRLNADPEIKKTSRIVVSSYDGVVLLAGQTPSEQIRTRAGDIVNGVPGVRRVYNEVSISGPISSVAQSNDTWITAKVKSTLLAAKGLDSSQIKVVTENGTVYLMGKVTRSQAQTASDVARSVAGVEKVITLFEYVQ